jgi:hypothetical protein
MREENIQDSVSRLPDETDAFKLQLGGGQAASMRFSLGISLS